MTEATPLQAPFPYFGGKSAVAELVWERFGDVPNYVEPFFGSGAMLLGRPHGPKTETVNDKDGLVANFWRALQVAPEAVALHADWPVNENDLHARHAWLVGQKDSLQARLEGDPEFHDVRIAGWWVWGMSCWIGGGFCSGRGPWRVSDGLLVSASGADGDAVERRRVHAGDAGRGVNRQLVHAGNAGQGVEHKRPVLNGPAGGFVMPRKAELLEWFRELAERLRRVRVCCGDWSRICGPSVTHKHGLTGVFLDPPYSDEAGRDSDLYRVDCGSVAHDVRAWALEQGENPLMRIALCGYEGEHVLPGWECVAWKTPGGNENCRRERIWFSPNCRPATQGDLFA